jgi:hypothetical protein
MVREYKYIFMSHEQNSEQKHNIPRSIINPLEVWHSLNILEPEQLKIAFMKHLRSDCTQGMPATIQSGIFILPMLSKNLKIKIYRAVILPLILYGCEAVSHIEGRTWTESVRE